MTIETINANIEGIRMAHEAAIRNGVAAADATEIAKMGEAARFVRDRFKFGTLSITNAVIVTDAFLELSIELAR